MGVVSFWTTARISGLEDYLRSEIGRRNSELNALSARSERAQSFAEKRAEALANLQFSADELAASFASTQARLEQAKTALGDLQLQAVTSQGKLSELNNRASAQADRLDLLNRRRVYQEVSMGAVWRLMLNSSPQPLGEAAYEFVVSSSAPADENDLLPYYAELRTAAALTCRQIKSYSPAIPEQIKYPEHPTPPGERVKGMQTVYKMTLQQKADWEKAQKDWSQKWDEASKSNDAASHYGIAAQRYAADTVSQCACTALATERHPASAICPGLKSPKMPEPLATSRAE